MKTVHFNSDFFINNRRRLREALGGQAPVVVAAHAQLQSTADQAHKFRQNSNFWYLTGIDEPDFVLVIDKNQDYLIAPKLSEYQQIFHGATDDSHLINISGVDVVFDNKTGWKRLNKRLKLAENVATPKPPPVFLEPYGLYTNPAPRRLFKQIKEANPEIGLFDIRLHLARLRMIKSEDELETMKNAIEHTIKAFNIVNKKLKNYATEAEIESEFSQYFIKNGLEHAYAPIVANGLRATTLHYEANNQEINPKHITLIDIGSSYEKYCSDLTRSYCANPTKRQQTVYNAVLATQEYAINLVKPGMLLKDYEKEIMLYVGEKLRELGLIRIIDKDTVREFAPHSTSHFLGLDAHDAADYDLPLEPGMVLTVEPGIYIKKEQIGVRIEDNILVTDNGSQNLSVKLPKTLS